MRRGIWATAAAAAVLASGAATGAGGPRIALTTTDALLDERVGIVVSGAAAHARVTVRASVEAADGKWTGTGVFRADRAGRVDVARSRSLGGTYRGRDAMGVFWSMNPPAGVDPFFDPPGEVMTFAIEALVRGRVIARTRLVRRTNVPTLERTTLIVDREGLVGRFSRQPGTTRASAVLLVGGSEGGMTLGLVASLLASRGYPTLELAYFRAPGLPQELGEIPLEYLERGLEWLASQPEVDPRRMTVFGISRGGELALLLGATYRELVAGVIAYVPSSVVNPALPSDEPAWTLGGQPIPHVSLSEVGDPTPQNTAAIILVERIRGPVLLVSGAQDSLWPSDRYAEAIVRRRAQSGLPTISIVSSLGGHGVGRPVPNVPVGTFYGGTRAADAATRARAWPQVLGLLRSLGTGSSR